MQGNGAFSTTVSVEPVCVMYWDAERFADTIMRGRREDIALLCLNLR
jgi:hypothetical protein